MAYRIGKDVTYQQMFKDAYRFMRELTSVSEVDYQSSHGDGHLFELSVPAATSTTETWTLTCLNDTFPAQFSVMGNLTGATADAYVNQFYDNGIIKFTLQDGGTPWVVGDIITFSTKSAIYTTWTPRTIRSDGDIEKSPMYVKSIYQKTNQFGSNRLPLRKGDFQLIEGPKQGSCAMSPVTKKGDSTYLTGGYYYAGEIFNSCAIGGPYWPDSVGRGDASAPEDFTVQVWVRNVASQRQDSYSGIDGQVIYDAVDRYSYGGTIDIQAGIGRIRIQMRYCGDNRYSNRLYQSWVHDFPMSDYLATCGKSSDDWFLITVQVSRSTDTINVYIDKEYLGTYTHSHISELRPCFGGIASMADVADPVLWRGILTPQQISDIYDSPNAVDKGAPEIYDALTWSEDNCLPIVDMLNKDNLGNPLTVQLFPQAHPYHSYRMDSIHNSSLMYNQTDPEIQNMNKTNYPNGFDQWHNKGTYPQIYVVGEDPVNTVIDKYWMVGTNEYLILVFKIFDQRTVQQLPVYQTLYVGRGDSLQDKLYTTVVGTMRRWNEYWYTNSADLQSGIYQQWSSAWFGHFLWQLPTRIGKPQYNAGYKSAGNTYNVWTVFHAQYYYQDIPTGRSSGGRMWGWNGWSQHYQDGLFTPEYMGSHYGLYGIQANEVTPEDIVIIDGIEHVTYTDCTQSGENSMLLLRLE